MPNQPTRVLVTGAGGFIGHHLVTDLKQRGCWVRGVDLKYPEYTPIDADEFELRDLRRWDECLQATRGVDHVYALAADMGGMGFISANFAADLDEFSDLEIEGTASLRCPHLSHISGWFWFVPFAYSRRGRRECDAHRQPPRRGTELAHLRQVEQSEHVPRLGSLPEAELAVGACEDELVDEVGLPTADGAFGHDAASDGALEDLADGALEDLADDPDRAPGSTSRPWPRPGGWCTRRWWRARSARRSVRRAAPTCRCRRARRGSCRTGPGPRRRRGVRPRPHADKRGVP
jgi:hypothetical protein